MLRVAIKGVLARKLRLLLTSVAIILGVGFVSGAFLFTDSLRQSFDTLFTEASEGIDTQVQSVEQKELVAKQATAGPTAVPIDLAEVAVPAEALETVRGVDGVAKAVGSVFEGGAQILDKDGKLIGGGGAPTFAASWDDEGEDVGALRIVRGEAPEPGEVMLDNKTVEDAGFELGDDVRILIQGGRRDETFELSGVVKFGTSGNLNTATIAVFETKTIQDLYEMGDRFTAISAQAEDGVSEAELTRRIDRALGPELDVITGAQFTQEQTEAIDSGFLNIFQGVILGFAAVAVFVGAFTIFNTFTILVGQRTREYGLLRAVGASRRQVLGIVTLEALVVGLIASTLGLLAGFGVANLLRWLINSAGPGGFPESEFVLHTRTVVWSYVVGVVVTLIASVIPAWRASRLSPLEALRANPAHAGRGWKAPLAGALLCLAGGAMVASGFNADDDATVNTVLTMIGGGFAIAIIGIALLSRLFIGPFARVVGAPIAHTTVGSLATRNVKRNRARSATTAAALMIGLALASLVIVFHGSLEASINDQVDRTLGADIVALNSSVLTSGVGVIDQDAVDTMAEVDGVAELVTQRLGGVALGDTYDSDADIKSIAAFDDEALGTDGLIRLEMDEGAATPGSKLLMNTELATSEKVKVGDEVELTFPNGRTRTLDIAGIYEPNELVGAPLIVSIETFDANEPTQLRAPYTVFISAKDGANPATVADRIEDKLGDDGSYVEVKDNEELREQFSEQLAPMLRIVLGMLSLSLIIALFGIGNTLALNVFERTREIGLLRAVGGTRWQLRWVIVFEAVLVAVFGALVGVLVGVGAGRALIAALADEGFVFDVSWALLAGVLVAGFVAGLLAALLPARRAARIDVLQAIATE